MNPLEIITVKWNWQPNKSDSKPKWVRMWENVPLTPVTSAANEYSNQTAHTRSLIRVFVVRMEKLCFLCYTECAQSSDQRSDCANGEKFGVRVLTINTVFRITYSNITKACLYNFDPLKSHLVKLGFIGVYIFFSYFAKNSARRFYRVPTIYVLSRNKKIIRIFYLKIFLFWL